MKRKPTLLFAAAISFIVAATLLTVMIEVNAETFDEEFSRPHSPQAAFQVKEDGSWTTWNKFWLATAIGGQTADAISTRNALDDGCREANLLYGSDPETVVIVGTKVIVLALAYLATEHLMAEKDRPKARNIIYGTLGVIGVAAAGWNASQSCE